MGILWALVRVVELDLKQLSSFVGGGLPFPLEYGHLSGLRQQRMTSLNLDILYSAIGGYQHFRFYNACNPHSASNFRTFRTHAVQYFAAAFAGLLTVGTSYPALGFRLAGLLRLLA
jgi:hypothetical protein